MDGGLGGGMDGGLGGGTAGVAGRGSSGVPGGGCTGGWGYRCPLANSVPGPLCHQSLYPLLGLQWQEHIITI